ncbi:Nucleolar complex protein 2 [Alternaria gaisen]|uniref:Nucleolar complex protein 2 n=1 Tax=Alternaria gaisen TaxID=167740 RepID=A0ACB6FQE0_9PLEO|nr:Nucleolar complex protein 2 [Alternaria gaisen]
MPVSKATKKFQKDKLGDVIKRRKDVAKVKQRKQMDAKKRERKARDNEKAADLEEEAAKKPKTNGAKDDKLGEMSMDQFFQGGFQIPEMKKKSTKPKTGKRKRTPVDEDADQASDEDMQDAPSGADESGSDSDSGDDVDTHKEQLAGLAEKDPEFYKYLKENDAELLDFAEDADLAEIDALSASEDEATPRKKQKAAVEDDDDDEDSGNELNLKTVQKWKASMESKHSLRAMKEVVLAFRAASHMNDSESSKTYKYSITDPDVYHQVQVTTLHLVPKVLQHHLPVKESAGGRIRVPTDSKKFRTLTPLLKSHTVSIHHLLENLSDSKTLQMTLDSLSNMLPYILSFKKVVREVIRSVASVWSDSANNDGTRVSAFLVLRRLVVIADPSIREAVLKQVYQGLVKSARNTTIHNIQGINLMKNTAAELWGIDPTVGYTTGFGFIRQLAIHLRTSITNKTKDSYKTVYNWQYIHSLDFWSRVISMHCESLREAEAGKPSPLRPLIYPVVQVTLGAMRLIPTSQYFPLRFQLIRSLLRIAQATSTYIPLAPALVEVLNSAEMKKPPKPSTLKALDFSISIRASKAFLRTRIYQDGIGEQVAELLAEFFILWTKNIAFPELALPVIVMLKRWVKAITKKSSGNKNTKVSSLIALLVQKLEANSRWVEEKRNKVEFAPNNRAGVESFLKDVEWDKSPLGAFVAGQRKSREQKQKLLEEARKTEDRKRKESEKNEKSNGEVFAAEDDDEDEEEEEVDLDGLSDEDLEMDDDDEEESDDE